MPAVKHLCQCPSVLFASVPVCQCDSVPGLRQLSVDCVTLCQALSSTTTGRMAVLGGSYIIFSLDPVAGAISEAVIAINDVELR